MGNSFEASFGHQFRRLTLVFGPAVSSFDQSWAKPHGNGSVLSPVLILKTGEYHIVLGSGFKGRRLSSRILAQNRKRRKNTFLVCTIGERSALRPTRMWSHKGANWVFLSAQPDTARHLGGTLVVPRLGSTCDACTVGQQFRRTRRSSTALVLRFCCCCCYCAAACFVVGSRAAGCVTVISTRHSYLPHGRCASFGSPRPRRSSFPGKVVTEFVSSCCSWSTAFSLSRFAESW